MAKRNETEDIKVINWFIADGMKESVSGLQRRFNIGYNRASNLAEKARETASGQGDQPLEKTGKCINEVPTLEWAVEKHEVNLKTHSVVEWRTWTSPLREAEDFTLHLYHMRIKPLMETSMEMALEAFRNEAANHAPKKFRYKAGRDEGKHLLELSAPDAHIGKRVWQEQTGSPPWGTERAAKALTDILLHLYGRSPREALDRVLLPIGNDAMHVDNLVGSTTALTRQDVDAAWLQIFRATAKAYVDVIEEIAGHTPVTVISVPGNHDEQSTQALAEYLAAWFRNHANVTVDNSAMAQKYIRYHKTMIGFAHGQNEKAQGLPLIMCKDNPMDYAQTTCHEWHLGHTHQEKTTEVCGDIIRVLPSISPTDKWHRNKLFAHNNRMATSFLYDQHGEPPEVLQVRVNKFL